MKILIVEGEAELLKNMVSYLKSENFICEEAASYAAARRKLEQFSYDCIVLDVTLPDGEGFALLKEIRQVLAAGVIVVSTRDSAVDRIEGLNMGADDFLTKPFHLSELNARLSAVIRRRYFNGQSVVSIAKLTIDLIGRTVMVGDSAIQLTRKEYDLLLLLARHQNKVISKEAIGEYLLGDKADGYVSYDFLYSHVKNLKRKLQEAGSGVTVKMAYGTGYKLE